MVVYYDSTACKRSEKTAVRLDSFGFHYVREYVEGSRHGEAAGLPRIGSGPAGTRMNPMATLAIHLAAALDEIAG